MRLPHDTTCMGFQETCHVLAFTGTCKDHRTFPRGFHCRRQWNNKIFLAVESWRYRKTASFKSYPQSCWNGEDGITSSNAEKSNTMEYQRSQTTNMQKALEASSASSSETYCGLKEVAKYAVNDARIVNARAREGFLLLARGFENLDRRARQDVALLGSGFLKLDARAREDTVKLDIDARRNAALLQSIAEGLTGEAQIQLKTAAEKHWSDGALDADLRLADVRAKRRAMEDAYMALQFVKSIHNGLVKRAYQRQYNLENHIMLPETFSEKREKSEQDQLVALQNAYWDIASAVVEADGIEYSDPEELELIISTLLDMDAVDGISSATMLAECANSPDVATRQALANALGNAPSLWALGNAGMGALKRLTVDVNPGVAAAASKAFEELKKQWQVDSEGSLTSDTNEGLLESLYSKDDEVDDDGDDDSSGGGGGGGTDDDYD